MKLMLIQKVVENVEWPEPTNDSVTMRPFIFGVFGDLQPFGEALLALQKNGLFKKRSVKVAFYENNEAFKSSQPDLIFVPTEYSQQIASLVLALGKKPTLIIAEKYNAVNAGAMIVFYFYDDALHCQLNLNAFRDRGMLPSVELIQLGE